MRTWLKELLEPQEQELIEYYQGWFWSRNNFTGILHKFNGIIETEGYYINKLSIDFKIKFLQFIIGLSAALKHERWFGWVEKSGLIKPENIDIHLAIGVKSDEIFDALGWEELSSSMQYNLDGAAVAEKREELRRHREKESSL